MTNLRVIFFLTLGINASGTILSHQMTNFSLTKFAGELCNVARPGHTSGFDCELDAPESQGWSGGFCLASMAEAGWLRTPKMNKILSDILNIAPATGKFPVSVGSNSGGSMFALRYLRLRLEPIANKWSYPCYLLRSPWKTVCFFHSLFGHISNECFSASFDMIGMAMSQVLGPLASSYGGPNGVVSVWGNAYFPFFSDLPMKAQDWRRATFASKYASDATKYTTASNWIIAYTGDFPHSAYTYGFDDYVSRGFAMLDSTYANSSLLATASASANVLTGLNMMPFAFASKTWNGAESSAAALKLFAMGLSYLMVRRLMAMRVLQDLNQINDEIEDCLNGCPIFDGGVVDNAPLTPILSQSSKASPGSRPTWLISIGAASTMDTVEYLMGRGLNDIFGFAGVNICPFDTAGACQAITTMREMVVKIFPEYTKRSYLELANAYQPYRPNTQLFAPYCGDPLAYDLFKGQCLADAVCTMVITVVPSLLNEVDFTPDYMHAAFVLAYLKATPVSARFVNAFISKDIRDLTYYAHMDSWFPNFAAMSPSKGGVGFSSTAGTTFLDFMTYLSMRLIEYIYASKLHAHDIHHGLPALCAYQMYETTQALSLSETDFLKQQANGAAR